MISKKVRGKNFNEQEALDLLSLVANHKKIIENKQTNATTNQEKIHVWKSITEQYNASHPLNTRTLEQLSAKYENLKHRARKYAAQNKQELYSTSGGPAQTVTNENLKHRARKYAAQNKQELYSTSGGPAQTVTNVVLDSVLSIIPKKSVEGELNVFDCDSESQTVLYSTSVDKNNYKVNHDNTENPLIFHDCVIESTPVMINTLSDELSQTTNINDSNNMSQEPSDTNGITPTANTTETPRANKFKPLRKRKKHDSEDVHSILDAKAKLYRTEQINLNHCEKERNMILKIANKFKPLRKRKKHDSEDVHSILDAKAKLYRTKAKLLELECNLKTEEVKNKVLQNQLLEEELLQRKETRLVRLALLQEELEEKKLHNLLLRAEDP
ncbi:Myb/SANT-like DNA-binding domain [Popillia japonica]|uniref:Regulatory protein zeste n=1 Tax=Popillia japonica TaxID=7064 RepID=A0AAW1MKF2_POPJA